LPKPLGYSLKFTLLPVRSWLNLGPGWAALAGALAGGVPAWNSTAALQIVALWLLVDPVLGSLWEVVVGQKLWQQFAQAELPPPPARGFDLPYAQPNSTAGRLLLGLRRYGVWWRSSYWPQSGGNVLTVALGSGLAILLAALLHPFVIWLTLLALALTLLAGFTDRGATAPGGGRLQSLAQFLLPWSMGLLLFPDSSQAALLVGGCYWCVYLGGLRLLGQHRRAEWLFFGGQAAVVGVLLALRLLPGAALVGVMLAAQVLLASAKKDTPAMLAGAQPYLVVSVLAAAVALGSWGG